MSKLARYDYADLLKGELLKSYPAEDNAKGIRQPLAGFILS